jgi:hypothetical protein
MKGRDFRLYSRAVNGRALVLLIALAGCVHRPVVEDDLRAATERALAERGLAPATLGIVGNMLAHEGSAPPAAPALLDALFADPLAAADAGALWQRAVAAPLEQFFVASRESNADFEASLAAYVKALQDAQRLLREATQPFDEAGTASALQEGLPAQFVPSVVASVDAPALRRATDAFIAATARFAQALRAPGVQFPEPGERDSPVGRIVIGSPGADRHGAGAALIVDPAGDDTYERSPALGGAVSVIVDLAGNDEYSGSDVAVRALAALVDLQGDDRYRMAGAGLGAAVAGASLLVDYAGDDVYEARFFAEGAGLLGIGALLDGAGDDRYSLEAYGQGYAFTGGLGVLWERGGNDAYRAGGQSDAWQRGGGISFAQGAAAGYRTPFGGGIGILRDEAGNDRYEAQMFAQGTAYYYSLGLLWDEGGRDGYQAVRYGQGNGVHQAVGVLRDESGEDRYRLSLGAGQGMGLDMAVGLLVDGRGDDAYEAGWLAQAAATGNGVGLLVDRDGEDRFAITSDNTEGWGNARWDRRLPSVAALVHEPTRASFTRSGKPAAPGAPQSPAAADDEPTRCPAVPPAAAPSDGEFAALLRRVALRLPYGDPDAKSYGEVLRVLIDDPVGAMAHVPAHDFTLVHALGETLQCARLAAGDGEAQQQARALDAMLDASQVPFLAVIAYALQRRPGPSATMAKLRKALRASPYCSLQSLAMASAPEAEAREALASSCWRLQAAAYERLEALGAATRVDAARRTYLPH